MSGRKSRGVIPVRSANCSKISSSSNELDALGRLVNAFLDLAEDFVKRKVPMTMEDCAKRLDMFLQLTGHELLTNAGSVSAAEARAFAESEFEKYRITQDRLYQSDFDRFLKDTNAQK